MCLLLGLPLFTLVSLELLEKSRVSDKPLDDEMNTPEEDQLSKALYTFLIQYCPEPHYECYRSGASGDKRV